MTNQEKRKAKLPDGELVDFHMFFVDKDGNPRALIEMNWGEVRDLPAQWVEFVSIQPYALDDQIQIFAIDLKTNERFEITDLYWFEENFVRDFDGDGYDSQYSFEVFVGGIMVYRSQREKQK